MISDAASETFIVKHVSRKITQNIQSPYEDESCVDHEFE